MRFWKLLICYHVLMRIHIKKVRDTAVIPRYQTKGAAAVDLCADITEPVDIEPWQRLLVPSGVAIELPHGYEAQVRARSGLSLKHGIMLANGIGTIDSDYRGEIGVILVNISDKKFTVTPGMRIAQMVICRFYQAELQEVDELNTTLRGDGGFGSTLA